MPSIGNFPIERFKNCTNLIVTLCDRKFKISWLDPSKSNDVKALIYKGSFIDCVEYLYGFISEVFKEYCKQYDIVVYTDSKIVGTLSIIQSMFEANVITDKEFNLLKKVFLVRNELIHNTLWDCEVYYKKLGWVVDQLMYYDLKDLCISIIAICNKVNNSYNLNGDKVLVVRSFRERHLCAVVPSETWRKF